MRRTERRREVSFPLGRLSATPGVLARLRPEQLFLLLGRHAAGDWGDCGAEDAAANDAALSAGGRLLSAYETSGGTVWVVTEADRSATTALLPSEY